MAKEPRPSHPLLVRDWGTPEHWERVRRRTIEAWNRSEGMPAPPAGDGPAASATKAEPIDATEKSTKARRRVPVNARFIALLQSKPHAVGWTAKQVATELDCAASSVVETLTWKSLSLQRDKAKAELATDRRRRPKASDIRRG